MNGSTISYIKQDRGQPQGQHLTDVDPDDEKALLNYRDAFELVSNYVGDGEPITEGLIREIHKRLVQGVRGDFATPGLYRKIQNKDRLDIVDPL